MEKKSTAVMKSGYKAAILSGLTFCGVFLLLLFVLAVLYHRGVIPLGREVLFGRCCLAVTALFAAWTTGRNFGGAGLLLGMLSTLVLMLFLLLVGVFTKNADIFNISFFYSAAALLFGGFLGGILSVRKKKRRLHAQNITKRNRRR